MSDSAQRECGGGGGGGGVQHFTVCVSGAMIPRTVVAFNIVHMDEEMNAASSAGPLGGFVRFTDM